MRRADTAAECVGAVALVSLTEPRKESEVVTRDSVAVSLAPFLIH